MGLERLELLKMRKEARKILFFDELDSTNSYVKESDEITDGTAVLAKIQTAGHGRMGRRFCSEEGGIYLSLCRKTSLKANELTSLTGMCAVAVSDAIEKVCGVRPCIKWMNDLLINGKKVCGILVENVFGGSDVPEKVVIGVGINVSQPAEAFDGELSGIASSLSLLTGKKADTGELVLAVLDELDAAFDTLNSGKDISDYIKKYREKCITLGKKIHILTSKNGEDPRTAMPAGEEFPSATALGIDEKFGLEVKHEDGKTETLRSGEVSVIQM